MSLVQWGNFEVVISDVMMPGADAFSICRVVKENLATSHVSVILLSGIHDPRLRLTALAAGADHCAAKPFDIEELRLRVRNGARFKRLCYAARGGP